MPVSASIYDMVGRGVQPVEDPQNALLKALKLQGAQQELQTGSMKMDEYRRGVERNNKLQQLLSGDYADDESRAGALVKGGFLDEGQKVLKNRADLNKQNTDLDAKRLEMASKRLELAGQGFGWLKDNPSPDNAIAVIDSFGQNGIWNPQQVAKAKADVMANPTPENVARLATMGYQSALSAKDQLPSFVQQGRGGTVATQRINPVTGKVDDVQSATVTQTEAQRLQLAQQADEAAKNRGVQIRGQNMIDARAREAAGIASGAAVADAGGPGQAAMVKQFGKAPPGYRWKPDGSAEAIPGGPADIKAGEAGAKSGAKREAQIAQAESVLGTIRDAKGLTGYTTAGVGGMLSGVPATPARNLQAKLETVKANLGFDRLQQMRDNSPTGGALGAVAVQELTALQSTVASLDQLQSPSQLGKALEKIEGHYTRWLDVMKQSGGGQGGATGNWGDKPAASKGGPVDFGSLK